MRAFSTNTLPSSLLMHFVWSKSRAIRSLALASLYNLSSLFYSKAAYKLSQAAVLACVTANLAFLLSNLYSSLYCRFSSSSLFLTTLPNTQSHQLLLYLQSTVLSQATPFNPRPILHTPLLISKSITRSVSWVERFSLGMTIQSLHDALSSFLRSKSLIES